MEKLLGIVVLGLLLVSCSSKKETALEKCTDHNYLAKKGFQIELIEKRAGWEYGILKNKLEKLKEEKKENWKIYLAYKAENPEDEKYKKLSDIWWKSHKAVDRKKSEISKFIKKTSMEELAILEFDAKINMVNYYETYRKCELEHDQTPTAFLKRWDK